MSGWEMVFSEAANNTVNADVVPYMCVDEVLWALRDDYIEMFGAGVSCTLTKHKEQLGASAGLSVH